MPRQLIWGGWALGLFWLVFAPLSISGVHRLDWYDYVFSLLSAAFAAFTWPLVEPRLMGRRKTDV